MQLIHLTTKFCYMKSVQLATANIPSVDVVKSNRIRFSICSFCTVFLQVILVQLLSAVQVNAQQADTAYQRVINERTTRIVNTLDITDAAKHAKVHAQVAGQYFALNSIHDDSKAAVTRIKAKPISKEEIAAEVKQEEDSKAEKLRQLHGQYIAALKTTLTEDQLEKVKDGMTYRILPVTWAAYMDMLQKLTREQKDTMYGWLLEARELAMDEGSSDKKHAVFGKYKGRINNYLSAAGYDMKKEGEEWAKRIQAAKDARQNSN